LFLFCTALTLAACLEPKYVRPKMPTPEAYKENGDISASSGTWKTAKPNDVLPRGKWWEAFGDTRLSRLEEELIAHNPSVQQAEAQFRQSRAILSGDMTGFFPTVTTNPSDTRSKNYNTTANTFSYSHLYTLPGTASWEPDLWGNVRLTVKGAAANAQASAANLENTRLSLEAELASDYFSMETLDMQQTLLSSATVAYQAAFDLTTNRFNAGIASQADVASAETQLDSTRAQYTDLGIQRAQLEHAIAILVGVSPSTFTLEPGEITGPPPAIPTGLPSQLLERRPDVAAAERAVLAANAGIGLARAAYFPVLSLGLTEGLENATLSQVLKTGSRFFLLEASAAETIIDFGKRGYGRKQAWATYDAAVSGYRVTVLSAFQQVEDNLAALRLLSQEVHDEDAAVRAAEYALQLELQRYTSGVDSYLNVITTQNIWLTNENTAVQIKGRRMTAAVTLIKALGGGWDDSQMPKGKELRATFKSGSHLDAAPTQAR
jgi:NodT family efflux transporter outer membrane factor (OMF) lipoprotein